MNRELRKQTAAIREGLESQSAKGFFQRIVERVAEFEAELDQEHEVGMKMASFGQAITFSVSAIGYIQPLLIVFHGHMNDGSPIELIQHVNQISFALIRLKREEPTAPRPPIGFIADPAGA